MTRPSSTQEIETTIQWIENGGSLLLAVDEDPIARGSVALAARLGVALRRRLVIDLGHSEPRFPERLVFSRENGLIGRHPVVDGFPDAPPVNRVVTFGGQALVAPPGAATLLVLSPSATKSPAKAIQPRAAPRWPGWRRLWRSSAGAAGSWCSATWPCSRCRKWATGSRPGFRGRAPTTSASCAT